MSDPTPIHEIFRDAIARAGFSNAKVARLLQPYGLKVSASTVTKWLSGERGISMETAMRLCDVLGVQWEDLYQPSQRDIDPYFYAGEAVTALWKKHQQLEEAARPDIRKLLESIAKLLEEADISGSEHPLKTQAISDALPQIIDLVWDADRQVREVAGKVIGAFTLIDEGKMQDPDGTA